jgi:hypothetical protein
MRWKIFLFSFMASIITESLGLVSTTSAADLAASVAPETAIPASAFFLSFLFQGSNFLDD